MPSLACPASPRPGRLCQGGWTSGRDWGIGPGEVTGTAGLARKAGRTPLRAPGRQLEQGSQLTALLRGQPCAESALDRLAVGRPGAAQRLPAPRREHCEAGPAVGLVGLAL